MSYNKRPQLQYSPSLKGRVRAKKIKSTSKPQGRFYHVTSWMEEEKILAEGLVPQEPYTEPGEEAVFLWDEKEMALKFAEAMYGEPPEDEPYIIFEVTLPPDVKAEKRKTHPKARQEFHHEYLVRDRIPPKNLRVVHRG